MKILLFMLILLFLNLNSCDDSYRRIEGQPPIPADANNPNNHGDYYSTDSISQGDETDNLDTTWEAPPPITTEPSTNPAVTNPTPNDPTPNDPTPNDPTPNDPPQNYGDVDVPMLSGGQNGTTTRYWDCCMPHCGWHDPKSKTCDISNRTISNPGSSGCTPGAGPIGYQCWNAAPWAVGDRVSYGFVAFNSGNCGDCYQLDFTSGSVSGKTMIVKKINIGGIDHNQFDIMIPGGGAGDFEGGCRTQFSGKNMGATWGGFRTTCGADASCIRRMCQDAFSGAPEMIAGCEWYIGWFQMADNPAVRFAPVSCPSALNARY